MKTLLTVALLLLALPALADQGPAGTCGGIDFTDDPQLDFRVYVLAPSDLEILGQIGQALKDACLEVVSLNLHSTVNSDKGDPWGCGVVLASETPACTPLDSAVEWLANRFPRK